MAVYTIEQILGYQNLTGIIQNPKGGIPDRLPPAFTAPGRPVQGKTATWYEVKGNRRVARLVQYGSPSERRAQKGVAPRSAIMMHTHEHMIHDASVLMQLRNMDNPQAQDMGRQTVATETAAFRQLFTNLRLAAVYSILANGKIWFDGNGELLPSSSGAVTTVDFSVPSTNNGAGTTLTPALTDWSNASADIIGQVKALKKAAVKATGYELKYAFYGTNILGYLAANTALKQLLISLGYPAFAARLGELGLPDGFLGLTWIPVEQAFFSDQNDANQDFFGAKAITFTPEPSPDWWELFQGTYPVPTNLGRVGVEATDAIGDIAQIPGMFSYAKILDDPVGIKHNAGDTFLPTLKVPSAIWIVTDVTA